MKPLRQVIEALRNELAAGGEQTGGAGGLLVIPRRVTLNLQVVVQERTGGTTAFFVRTTATGPDATIAVSASLVPHQLTIEFEVGSPAGDAALPKPANGAARAEPSRVAGETAPVTGLFSQLEQMFGPPGFDNAARATVFREAVERLDDQQRQALLRSFIEDRNEVAHVKPADSAVAVTRTRIARVLKLGPAGFAQGLAAMIGALTENSFSAVLSMIRARWKTQSDWIDQHVPGVTRPPNAATSAPE